ncbi:hypothetical protein M011DRAFT_489117, partial [Sporormia fimetaria CBS 119925]
MSLQNRTPVNLQDAPARPTTPTGKVISGGNRLKSMTAALNPYPANSIPNSFRPVNCRASVPRPTPPWGPTSAHERFPDGNSTPAYPSPTQVSTSPTSPMGTTSARARTSRPVSSTSTMTASTVLNTLTTGLSTPHPVDEERSQQPPAMKP